MEFFNKNILKNFLTDILFYFSFFGIITTLTNSLAGHSKKIESTLMHLNSPTNVNLANSELVMEGMKGLMNRTIIYFVLALLAFCLLYIFFKGFIYLTLSKKNPTKKFFKEFAKFSSVWILIIIFLNAFLILLLLFLQQLDSKILQMGLIFSFFLSILIYYVIMIANIEFSIRPRFSSILIGLKQSVRLKRKIKPLLILITIIIVISYLWSFLALKSSDAIKFNGLSILYLYTISWFRYTIHSIEKKIKHK